MIDLTDDRYHSVLSIAVRLDMNTLAAILNSRLSGLLFQLDAPSEKYSAKVWKHGEIKLLGAEGKVVMDVPLRLWLRGTFEFQPVPFSTTREMDLSLIMRFICDFSLTRDGAIKSTTLLGKHRWIDPPKLSVLGRWLSVAPVVDVILSRFSHKITEKIDQRIDEAANFQSQILEFWDKAHQPVRVSASPSVWLAIPLKKMEATPIFVKSDVLTLAAQASGAVRVALGETPLSDYDYGEMPWINRVEKVYKRSFLRPLAQITFEEASRLANERLAGRRFPLMGGNYEVEVESVQVSGLGEDLIIRAQTSGAINGIISISGRPFLSPADGILALRDIEFDIETKNILARAAASLMHQPIRKTLENKLSVDVGKLLSENIQMLTGKAHEALARRLPKEVKVEVDIEEARLEEISLTDDGIEAMLLMICIVSTGLENN